MICTLHKTSYTVSCTACDQAKKSKDLVDSQIGPTLQWTNNPLYEPRNYNHAFRGKLMHALTLIAKFPYSGMVNKEKLDDLWRLLKIERLDDVFKVARTETEWTGVVKALGGQHGPVHGPDGKQVGIAVAFGCTTYSRVASDRGQAVKDEQASMYALFEDAKVIYLHGKSVDVSTLVHELFHYVCDRSFYTVFGMPDVGPEWKTLNEGITEHFARLACPTQSHGAYAKEVDTVALLLSKTSFTEAEMAEAYFKGNIARLVEIIKAGEYKASDITAAPGMDKVLALAGGGRRPKK